MGPLSFDPVSLCSVEPDEWVWRSVDEKESVALKGPKQMGAKHWKEFLSNYDMCLTGNIV